MLRWRIYRFGLWSAVLLRDRQADAPQREGCEGWERGVMGSGNLGTRETVAAVNDESVGLYNGNTLWDTAP
jgi:hypothetical protein